ncbi:hypothetical protein [Streptomyces sp.]|uniref:hypothetical protein n=1 Tax=Streptomyces sp. TaxID=1931 RepID=UPI002810FF6F|nr:hypothetical protein [Streptomyces sp.]
MSRKDPEVKGSALQIYDAQKRPERTFPSFVGKSVPGEKKPLHRLVDKDKQDENRAKSISECKKVWGNYTGSGLESDEYPCASTREGPPRATTASPSASSMAGTTVQAGNGSTRCTHGIAFLTATPST